VITEDSEDFALTLDGEKKKLNWSHFEKLGKNLELTDKQIQGVYKRLVKNKLKAHDWINKSFLSDKMKKAYTELVENRYKKLS
jgi:serine/threonine-protein kinase HipA